MCQPNLLWSHDALGKMTPIEFYQQAEVSTFELST